MKRSFIKVLVLAGMASALTVQAVPITGGVFFSGGTLTLNGAGTGITAISGTVVQGGGQAGSYLSVPALTAVTWTPFNFNPFPGSVDPLWTFTVGSTVYSFKATSLTLVEQSPGFLNLYGSGLAHISGGIFDDTAGNWVIHSTGESTVFTFGASTTIPATAVPDGGATVALLGVGICGLSFLRRKIS